ncbi:hypothetical protein FQ179_09730 [Pusillimonas sp. ANT_WB101]|nr:hypothetical protein FQ179_09730 [Pusillimonas sp. ANT_WB101]
MNLILSTFQIQQEILYWFGPNHKGKEKLAAGHEPALSRVAAQRGLKINRSFLHIPEFVEQQSKRVAPLGNHLIMFINRAMNPVSCARDPGTFTWRRVELNVVLAFSPFQPGWVASVPRPLNGPRREFGECRKFLAFQY